jgi:hypothetical protein
MKSVNTYETRGTHTHTHTHTPHTSERKDVQGGEKTTSYSKRNDRKGVSSDSATLCIQDKEFLLEYFMGKHITLEMRSKDVG